MKLPEVVSEHFADPYHCGSCLGATHAAECQADSHPCIVRIELLLRDGVVREAWFEADGCECCEGLASLLVEFAEGKPEEQLQHVSLTALVSDEPVDEFDWPECWQLPITALQAALSSPLDSVDEELGDFSGPSLREEC